MEPVYVYGAGSWGTALAWILGRKGISVRLWDLDPEHRKRLGKDREHRKYLPGILLPDTVEVVHEDSAPDPGSSMAVIAVPSHGLRGLVASLPMSSEPVWILATKGLEEETCLTMSQVLESERNPGSDKWVVLAGPSLAAEVVEEKPTAVLAASLSAEAAEAVQRLFATERFRVYSCGDPLGVQICTGLKNVVAVAAGIVDGLGFGQNTRGALLTRGLAEIRRLGQALGAKPETFLGLAGVGDLVTTCTSPLSRNHTLGEALGRGEALDAAMKRIGMVVEGVRTARAARDLSRRHGVEMPITEQVCRILFEGLSPETALRELMTRPLRGE